MTYDELSARVTTMEVSLKRIEGQLETVLDIIQTASGFFRVLGVIGRGAKWIVAVGAAIALIWHWFKDK